eukprot:scaffold7395_cov95-Isochrysis_galbana.AAC.2
MRSHPAAADDRTIGAIPSRKSDFQRPGGGRRAPGGEEEPDAVALVQRVRTDVQVVLQRGLGHQPGLGQVARLKRGVDDQLRAGGRRVAAGRTGPEPGCRARTVRRHRLWVTAEAVGRRPAGTAPLPGLPPHGGKQQPKYQNATEKFWGT